MQLAARQQQQLLPRPRRDADQRGAAQLPRPARSRQRYPLATMTRRHPRHGLQGRQRRPARVALVQAPQDPRVRGGARSSAPTSYIKDPAFLPLEEVARAVRPAVRRRAAPRVPRRSSSRPTSRSSTSGTSSAKGALPVVKILVTGSAGFIAGYLVEELLGAGHEVVGLDNFSKYGPVERGFDAHPRYRGVDGRRQGRRPAQGAARRLRPVRRRRGDHRRHLALPRAGLRPDRRERADHRRRLRRRDLARTRSAQLQKITVVSSSMVYESTDVYPDARGRAAALPAAAVDLRLPEAGDRVLRPGGPRAVRPALHDRPAVQLRRHRREAGPVRQGGHVGQRQAGDEPRRARPGPEGAQGPGPAAHPGRRPAGPPLHLRRRPRARHPPGDRVARRASTRTSTSRRDESTTVLELAELIWRKIQRRRAVPLRLRRAVSPTTCRSACPSVEKAQRRARLRGDDVARPRRSTRSSRGSRPRSRSGESDAESAGDSRRSSSRLYARPLLPSAERAAKARLWRTLCDAFFSRYVPADGTVSTSAPATATSSTTSATRRIAIDLNPDTVRSAAPGVEVHRCRWSGSARRSRRRRVDLAFASNVFEHLRGPDVLLEVLAAIRARAAAGRTAHDHAAERPRAWRRVLGLLRSHASADREGDGRGARDGRASRSSSAGPVPALHDQEPAAPVALAGPALPGLAPRPVAVGRQMLVVARRPTMSGDRPSPTAVDFIMPVYNEGREHRPRAGRDLRTRPAAQARPDRLRLRRGRHRAGRPRARPADIPGVELVKNTLGRGVVNAIRAGIAATTGRGRHRDDGRPVGRPERSCPGWSS